MTTEEKKETRIYKYELLVGGKISITMPTGAQVLSVQVQHDTPCIWVQCECEPERIDEIRHFVIRGTGHLFDGTEGDFVGTFQMNFGRLVFHLFEAKR